MPNEADSTASRKLRELALDFSAAILANQNAFLATARWLRALPRCRHEKSTANRISHEIIKEDDEDNYAEIWGPICRRLEDGWSCATYRFPSGSDRFIDFGVEDAKQLALLAALTFDKDFDGAELGLGWTWEAPLDSTAQFEGRSLAWSNLSFLDGSEVLLLEFVEEASKVLRIKLPFLQQRVSGVVGADPDAQLEREERARVRLVEQSSAPQIATSPAQPPVKPRKGAQPAQRLAAASYVWAIDRWPDLAPMEESGRNYARIHEAIRREAKESPYGGQIPSLGTWKRQVRAGLGSEEAEESA